MTKSRGIAAPRRYWSEADIELLRATYAGNLTADLAELFGRTTSQVLAKAKALGLRKSVELIAETARQRTTRPGHGSVHTRFQKGLVPANKGLRRPGYAPGDMAKTQFKPGSRPHTWVPVGTFRVVEGDILEQKFSDNPGPPGKRWRAYARILWEAANGPVPDGHAVVFKPGRHTTDPALVTLDVLECITRRDLMARNTVHNMPPQLVEVTRLRAAISRQINKRSKDQP